LCDALVESQFSMPNSQSPTRPTISTRLRADNLAAIAAGAVILLIVLGTMPRILW
jgi:hypothetical protein